MPKVSIIIPVYNTEKYLEKCLLSIINQTLTDIEIICINDGSTDNSLDILNKFGLKDKRIKIITQKNAGLSCARNTGIDNATGEYIGFVDSDDWIDLDFFEKQYNTAKKYNADVAASGIKRGMYKWKYHLKIENEQCTENTDKKFVLCDVPEKCYVWNKIYKFDKLKQYNIKFEPNVYFEDRYFTAEVLVKTGKLVTVPNTYYYYQRRPHSLVRSKSAKISKDCKYTNKKMMEFLKSNNVNLDHYFTDVKKIKLFGLTLAKIKYYKSKNEYSLLFNQIKFVIPK